MHTCYKLSTKQKKEILVKKVKNFRFNHFVNMERDNYPVNEFGKHRIDNQEEDHDFESMLNKILVKNNGEVFL